MSRQSYQTETSYRFVDGDTEQEQVWEVEAIYTPGRPACLSGPPENCYPAEGPEVDLVEVYDARTGEPIPQEVVDKHSEAIYDKICDQEDARRESSLDYDD